MADSQKNAESQIDKFRETARKLETDQSEDHFDAMVKKIAKAQPKPDKPKNAQ